MPPCVSRIRSPSSSVRSRRIPISTRDIVDSGFVKDVTSRGRRVSFNDELTTPLAPSEDSDARQAARAWPAPGVSAAMSR